MKFKLSNDEIVGARIALMQIGEKEPPGQLGLKVALISKATLVMAQEIQIQRRRIQDKHAEKFPEGHEKAGQFVPRYQANAQGEREVVQGERVILDQIAFEDELAEFGRALTEIDCPSLTSAELKSMNPKPNNIVSMLWNLDQEPAPDVRPSARRRSEQAKQ